MFSAGVDLFLMQTGGRDCKQLPKTIGERFVEKIDRSEQKIEAEASLRFDVVGALLPEFCGKMSAERSLLCSGSDEMALFRE